MLYAFIITENINMNQFFFQTIRIFVRQKGCTLIQHLISGFFYILRLDSWNRLSIYAPQNNAYLYNNVCNDNITRNVIIS